GLLVPAGTLQILASSTTLQGRLRGQVSRNQFEAFCLAVHE
ncbi:MAG: hypothetical protein ACI8TQ_003320, partial [Planctomycetota bacterium]